MSSYIRNVQYYETDKMGIVHHSNYIRWFEEARIDFMNKIGISYKSLEEKGYFSPVLAVNCEYKRSVTFGDSVEIKTRLQSITNVKFSFEYEIINIKTTEQVLIGSTSHCFLNADGKVVSLKRQDKDLYDLFKSYI